MPYQIRNEVNKLLKIEFAVSVFVDSFSHTERERIRKSWKEFMKATLKIPSHIFLLDRSPLQFFQNILPTPSPFCF